MPALTTDELVLFASAVDGVLARAWPLPRSAGDEQAGSMLADLWGTSAKQGWTSLAVDGAVDALLMAVARCGRVACPLPLVDVYVAAQLLAGDPNLRDSIVNGDIRPVVAVTGQPQQRFRFVEGAGAATHVLSLVTGARVVRLLPIVDGAAQPGLAKPDWWDVTVGPVPSCEITASREAFDQAVTLMRLGLVVRAIHAADRSLEHAIQHAKDRFAFGKAIGSFQAVSHRAANGSTDMAAAKSLISQAVQARLSNPEEAILASELAVEFSGPAAVRTQFGAAHTLAAPGYFEEHDAPWLFRRVNADVAKLEAFAPSGGSVADLMIETGEGLPSLNLGEQAEAFRHEVREFVEPFRTGAAVIHERDRDNPRLTAAAAERGYITISWPAEEGGRNGSVEEQMVLSEELSYARVPLLPKARADMLGIAIIRHGTPEQKARFLPLLASGELRSYLGYSEPEVGSDLSKLRTKAVRDGDEWVVNGQKSWGTAAHLADWVWLATRTDPDASPPHAGITVFFTRTDRPGFELQKHRALSGNIACTTFFDDFRIPDADRIGEVNGGWKVISEALAKERVLMANIAADLRRRFDDLLAEVRKDPAGVVGGRGSAKRAILSELGARLQAARVLVGASVRATATSGGGGRLEAPMAKIIASQLDEDFGEAVLRILGPAAALGEGAPEVPGGGAFEYGYRYSIMQVVGGGTIDIQRNLVARSLGLPR